jgi:hypothetical protein
LEPLEFSSKAAWPTSVIYDAKGNYSCLVDWDHARHDPSKGVRCQPGSACRLEGTYDKKIGRTYFIDSISSIAAAAGHEIP